MLRSGFHLRYQLFLWMYDNSGVPSDPTLDLETLRRSVPGVHPPMGHPIFLRSSCAIIVIPVSATVTSLGERRIKKKYATCVNSSSRHPSIRTTRAPRRYKMKGCFPPIRPTTFQPKVCFSIMYAISTASFVSILALASSLAVVVQAAPLPDGAAPTNPGAAVPATNGNQPATTSPGTTHPGTAPQQCAGALS